MFDCHGPIWQGDDFSECVKDDYFLILFPVIACSISFILAAYQAAAFSLDNPTKDGYLPINQANGHANGSSGQVHQLAVESNEEEDDDLVAGERLLTEISKPRGGMAVLSFEVLLIAGQVAVHIATLVTGAFHRHSLDSQFTRAATWIYIFCLGILRLLFTVRRLDATPQLWYHTAWLYFVQFFFSFWVFRGDLIAQVPRTRLILASTDFALSAVLFVIALSFRRGNRVIRLVYNEKLRPSPEPMASLFSLASFAWADSIIYLGYKRPLEITDVYDLVPTAKARRLVADFKTVTQASRLMYRLMLFFKWDLLYQFSWTVFGSTLQFAPTLLLKVILEYVENPTDISPNMAWLYAIGMLVFGMLYGVGDGFALWRGREICIKIRALLVSEVYAKTLRRKAAAADEKEESDTAEGSDGGGKNEAKQGWKAAFTRWFKSKAPIQQPKHASSGQIINLMSVDAFKVSEICGYLHFLFPMVWLELAIAIALLWNVLGWSAIASLIIMVLLLPVNTWFTQQFQKAQKMILERTDARINTTNEVLSNVRIVKFFAWEEKYMRTVNEKRAEELKAMRFRFRLWIFGSCIWSSTPLIITGFSFFLYTVVEGRPLLPSVAFTALSLFGLLRYPLDRLTDMLARVLEAKVSIDRVEKYLSEEETGKYEQLQSMAAKNTEDDFVGFKNATCTWGSADEATDTETPAFRMIGINIAFKEGGLNIVAGPTGSGKTSLLMALLGEMTLTHGSVRLPGGYIRETLAPDLDGLTESVAYCAQQAWLVNDTIRQNIVFASPWDAARYEAVVDACALRRDLEVLEAGDATLVGEKGIVVSGGQKQRISLARALYCNARYVLLDDCLSAVDSHTAQHIFDGCINGPMMAKRTCILVTHNISLTVPSAKYVVLLENGKVQAQGTPEQLRKKGAFGDALDSRPGSRPASRAGTGTEQEAPGTDQNGHDGTKKPNGKAQQANGKDDKALRDDVEDANRRVEGKSEGAVAFGVIKMYFSSMGSWIFPLGIVGSYIATNLSSIATNLWIRQWANSYETKDVRLTVQNSQNTVAPFSRTPMSPDDYLNSSQAWAMVTGRFMWFLPGASQSSAQESIVTKYTLSDSSSTPKAGYYLGIYVALGVLYILISAGQGFLIFGGSLRASQVLHGRLLEVVMRAKFKFFDTTPLGQIMNRFSKDLQAIDLDIAGIAAAMLQYMIAALSTIALISAIIPRFLLAAVFLAGLYIAIGLFYVNSSRDLKRMESTNRSPLYQQFGETLTGITTIRAYGDEQRFIRDNASRIDTHNRPFIYLWATNRWLALRVQWAGALVSFFASMFILLSVGKLDAGAAGVSLAYALTFNESMLWLVRCYADNEQNMNHVERIKQYLDVEQEGPAKVPARKPADSWPAKGAVEFVKYTTRYRSDLEPVLKNLSVKIEGQEKVGIVGRTGAGKSSFALALFRGLEADSGQILVDDVDIGLIGLQDLREAITMVPQDPTLFTGTVRSNLDPFGLFTDDQIFNALRQVHLIGTASTSASRAISGAATPAFPGSRTFGAKVLSPQDESPPDASPELHPVDDPGNVTADVSAHFGVAPPALEPTVSRVENTTAAGGPDPNVISRVLTNTRENVNVFKSLASPIAESGSNLSQGQRQLLCLARALLKQPRVLLMDEATASIDYRTDAKIQTTLREIRGSTIITIAHRLKTIIDYDKVMVLDKGEIVEYGPPWELIERTAGTFRGLCESSGEFDVLLEAARRAGGGGGATEQSELAAVMHVPSGPSSSTGDAADSSQQQEEAKGQQKELREEEREEEGAESSGEQAQEGAEENVGDSLFG